MKTTTWTTCALLAATLLACPPAEAQEFGLSGFDLGFDLNGLVLPTGPSRSVTQLPGGLGFVRDLGVASSMRGPLTAAASDAWASLPPSVRSQLGITEFQLAGVYADRNGADTTVAGRYYTEGATEFVALFAAAQANASHAQRVQTAVHETGHRHADRMSERGQDPTQDPTFLALAQEEGLLDAMTHPEINAAVRAGKLSLAEARKIVGAEAYAEAFRRATQGVSTNTATPVHGYSGRKVKAERTVAYVNKAYLDQIDTTGLNLKLDINVKIPSINLGSIGALNTGLSFTFTGFSTGLRTPVITITEMGVGPGGM